MESGLEGRNNPGDKLLWVLVNYVSMESGLEGRNNELGDYYLESGTPASQWSPA